VLSTIKFYKTYCDFNWLDVGIEIGFGLLATFYEKKRKLFDARGLFSVSPQPNPLENLLQHLYFHNSWAAVNVDPTVKDGGTIIHREFNRRIPAIRLPKRPYAFGGPAQFRRFFSKYTLPDNRFPAIPALGKNFR